MKISLERSEDQRFSPAVVITGVAMTIFGVGVYYVMPLSLLSSNIQVLLFMYFFNPIVAFEFIHVLIDSHACWNDSFDSESPILTREISSVFSVLV